MVRPEDTHIQFLTPEVDPFPDGGHYQAAGLLACWKGMGFRVSVARGLGELSDDADLVFPHVDLTVTPPEWQAVLDGLPNVVNAGLYDISKSRISTNLVQPGDGWSGPVIVKTDLNYAGRPEGRFRQQFHSRLHRGFRKLRRRLRPREHRDLLYEVLNGYTIFEAPEEVPPWVFRDPSLVVERFLPEREGDVYYIRYWFFMGDRYRCMRIGATQRIVKSRLPNQTSKDDGYTVPDEVREMRARLRMDFGKIDFVMHEGRGVVIDVNRTPGGPPPERVFLRCGPLAPGVLPVLDRSDPPVWEREGVNVDLVGAA